MRVQRYTSSARAMWDGFVETAKNGTFLFCREYMEYHSDRFADYSVMFFDESRLVAVMPANLDEDSVHSHAGLTFGGMVTDGRMSVDTMLRLFDALLAYLQTHGIIRLLYKRVPYIYHRQPADEDLYALFRHGAALIRRDVSSTIWMSDRPRLAKGRRWSARRAATHGLEVRESLDFDRFMAIAKDQLCRRHGLVPTHTGQEMQTLASRFPQSIRLFGAYRDDDLLGGVIMYESPRVAHVQYMAASDEGRRIAVLDRVLDVLLNQAYATVPYVDFGISTEDGGRHLNPGLAAYKESFGARTIAYDTYELAVS